MSDPKGEHCWRPDVGPVLEGWLTREELAREFRLSVKTLERWASLGVGPVGIRVGLRTLYSRDAVRKWLRDMEERAAGRRK